MDNDQRPTRHETAELPVVTRPDLWGPRRLWAGPELPHSLGPGRLAPAPVPGDGMAETTLTTEERAALGWPTVVDGPAVDTYPPHGQQEDGMAEDPTFRAAADALHEFIRDEVGFDGGGPMRLQAEHGAALVLAAVAPLIRAQALTEAADQIPTLTVGGVNLGDWLRGLAAAGGGGRG